MAKHNRKTQSEGTTPKVAVNLPDQAVFTLKEAAAALNLSEMRVRKAIMSKVLPTTKEPIGDTNVVRHMIKYEDLVAWRQNVGNRVSKRADGRSRFNFLATPDEVAKVRELMASQEIGALIEKPINYSARSKAKKLAAAKAVQPEASI